MKILCIIPTLPNDLQNKAIQSILHQSVPVSMIVILPNQPTKQLFVPPKLSRVLNEGLSHLKLDDFDYLLRLDADTFLPPTFLEENLKANADLSGNGGASLLIKLSTFQKTMHSQFISEDEDSYIGYKFLSQGFKVVDHRLNHILLRKSGGHGIMHFWYRGKIMYKNGFEPFHVFASLFWTGTLKHSVSILSYFFYALKGEKRFDVARFVWNYQVWRLIKT